MVASFLSSEEGRLWAGAPAPSVHIFYWTSQRWTGPPPKVRTFGAYPRVKGIRETSCHVGVGAGSLYAPSLSRQEWDAENWLKDNIFLLSTDLRAKISSTEIKITRILTNPPKRVVSRRGQTVCPEEGPFEIRRMIGKIFKDLLLLGIARKIIKVISSPSSGGVAFQTKEI